MKGMPAYNELATPMWGILVGRVVGATKHENEFPTLNMLKPALRLQAFQGKFQIILQVF
jgi:hypothetical protein